MERDAITEEISELSEIVLVTIEDRIDTIFMELIDVSGNTTKLELDYVSANGIRISLASLRNIPPLTLPKSAHGEYQCHYMSVSYEKDGEVLFEKEIGITEPLGLYTQIEDGLILFNGDDLHAWMAFDSRDSELGKDYLVLLLDDELSELVKLELDKIFPFNRFGKYNRLCYGYFNSNSDA